MDKFLVFWLGSSALSIGVGIKNELNDFKDAADEGYKINMEKWSSLTSNDSNLKKIGILLLITPGINLLSSLYSTSAHVNSREERFFSLNAVGALEPMSDFEKKVYSEKPSALRALFISPICNLILSRCIKITKKNEDGVSEIYFDYDKKRKKIRIVNVTGPYSKLSEKELLEVITESLLNLLNSEEFKEFCNNKKEEKQLKSK